MKITNFEFKVRTKNLDALEQQLIELNPSFIGEDHQTDTYYNLPKGRLKLREGNIENALIYYERENIADAKLSDVLLYQHLPAQSLKDILAKLFGVKIIVDKKRRIYCINNVKFHFDTVKKLGTFPEVEAIDNTGETNMETLEAQCDHYFSFFKLDTSDYINCSYSDLLLSCKRT